MLKRKYMIIGFLALCLTATLFVSITASGNQNGMPVNAGGTPTVYLDPPLVVHKIGENFTVDIGIRDLEAASHLLAWEATLGYYNITLEALDCEEGPFLEGFEGPAGTFFVYILDQASGCVQLDGLFLDLPDGDHDGIPGEEEDWPYGTGVLATTTFKCTKAGECVLDLYDTRLIGRYPNGTLYSIPHNVEDGYVVVPRADVNYDGEVDIYDVVIVGIAYGAKRIDDPEDPRYGEYWHDPPCPQCPH